MGHENSKNDLVKIFLPIKWTWGYQTITNVLFFLNKIHTSHLPSGAVYLEEGRKMQDLQSPLFKICACFHLR